MTGKAGPDEAIERLHGLTRDPGHAAKRIGHPGPRLRGEERQNLVAHLVPEELRVPIRAVLHDLEAVGREVDEHRGATDIQEGTDDPTSPRGDSGQPAGPGPLKDPHENGLGLILGGVAERDAPGPNRPRDLFQCRMASEARRFLGGPAPRARNLDSDDVGRAVQTGRQGLDEGGVPVSLGSETMVYVTDAELERELGTEEDERVQEGDGIRPP
jgi:hypothetical protein